MMMRKIKKTMIAGGGLAVALLFPVALNAHCDSFDGPIIPDAQAALRSGDVSPILKWVEPDHESEIITAFERARNVAEDAPAAKELAELWFLETFVRLHREGEGAPYTGLKPAGSMLPIIGRADAALEQGSADDLADYLGHAIAQEIRQRFAKANRLQETADESSEAGREFVAAYVDYVHFVEALHGVLHTDDHHHH